MSNFQGKGKVRLIARNGRYAESAYTDALRKSALEGKIDPKQFGEIMGKGNDAVKGETLKNAEVGRGNYYVEFETTPDITEQGSVNYYEEGGIRGPASIMMYMGSPSRSFSLSAKFVARNEEEAERVSRQIHTLKSWRMPESYTGGFAQKPPAILLLQGYGKMFKDIPVVMMDLSIEFSSEYDSILIGGGSSGSNSSMSDEEYARANGPDPKPPSKYSGPVTDDKKIVVTAPLVRNTMVPIIVPISITLKEVHNTGYAGQDFSGLSTFDILKYRTGQLAGW